MAKERESGEILKQMRMPDPADLAVRVTLAERAIADASIRIAELTEAVVALMGGERPVAPAGPLHAVIDADAVSPFALGFYQREFDKLGRPFRWTGKGSIFELRLRLDRNVQWSFAMEVQPNPNVDTALLRAFVDYVEVPTTADPTGKVLSGIIPERLFSNLATLTFMLPKTFVPAQVNPAVQDSRTLGLIFYELRLTTAPATSRERISQESRVQPEGSGAAHASNGTLPLSAEAPDARMAG